VDCYKSFDIAEVHVSDCGSHYRNPVRREFNRLAGTRHHFATAYVPWSNGTVKRANREILQSCLSLCNLNSNVFYQLEFFIL
jgi:hypothetical protein